MKDLVIRGGTWVDRTAAEPREGDVAIENGVITEVGSGLADGRVTWRHGEHTGALPGRLIRGAQSA